MATANELQTELETLLTQYKAAVANGNTKLAADLHGRLVELPGAMREAVTGEVRTVLDTLALGWDRRDARQRELAAELRTARQELRQAELLVVDIKRGAVRRTGVQSTPVYARTPTAQGDLSEARMQLARLSRLHAEAQRRFDTAQQDRARHLGTAAAVLSRWVPRYRDLRGPQAEVSDPDWRASKAVECGQAAGNVARLQVERAGL